MTIENINQSMSQTFHEDPKESQTCGKWASDVPFKVYALFII